MRGLRVVDLFDPEYFLASAPHVCWRSATSNWRRQVWLITADRPRRAVHGVRGVRRNACGRTSPTAAVYVFTSSSRRAKRVLFGARGAVSTSTTARTRSSSSNDIVTGTRSARAGIPPRAVNRVIGISEGVHDARRRTVPDRARRRGRRQAARGRRRVRCDHRTSARCGWFGANAVVVQAAHLSGMSGDHQARRAVRAAEAELAVAYEVDGKAPRDRPWRARAFAVGEAGLRGRWMAGPRTSAVARRFEDLPAACPEYISHPKLTATPVTLISVGTPERGETILLRDPFLL